MEIVKKCCLTPHQNGSYVTGDEDFITIPRPPDALRNQALQQINARNRRVAQQVLDADQDSWTGWMGSDQPWQISEDRTWNWNDELAARGLFGGKATLYYQTRVNAGRATATQSFPFVIGGRNPDDGVCKAYINNLSTVAMTFGNPAVNYSHDFWYGYAISKHESKIRAAESRSHNAMADPTRWYGEPNDRINYNQFRQGRMDPFPAGFWSNPGMPNHNPDNVRGGTGGYGLFQLTFGAGEIYHLANHGRAFTSFLPGDRRDGNGNLILNPMPRRWKWDWKSNVKAQMEIKFPVKFGESRIRLGQYRAAAELANGGNPLPIPNHSVSRQADPTQGIPAGSELMTGSDTVNGGVPASSLVTFAEEIDPNNNTLIRVANGAQDFLDLQIIKYNNGGWYIRWDNNQWEFRRGRPTDNNSYVDLITIELEENRTLP